MKVVRKYAKDPFVLAFAIGALTLTVLPFLQRLMLTAPEPLAELPAFGLAPIEGGGTVGSEDLLGKVWIASFVASPCDQPCRELLASFGRAAGHLDDLKGQVELVSFVPPDSVEVAKELSKTRSPAWRLLVGAFDGSPLWQAFSTAWSAQTKVPGAGRGAFLAQATLAVVDQGGAVRGFWPANEQGRGHAINAARMFARRGAEP
ncbi:MAG: hypothetical protein HYV07_12970 [Deltaproteobacteria bacterium]|nr:hypothetical protein [Deltaproteobacteria bacterium]